MKITQFNIRNFKSFGNAPVIEQDRVAGLSNINMIYGNNNSGKSNLLKFMNLIFEGKRNSGKIEVEGESIRTPSTSNFWWSGTVENCPFIFHKNDKSKPIEYHFVIRIEDAELESHNPDLFKLISASYKTGGQEGGHEYLTLKVIGKIVNYENDYDSEIELEECELNGKTIYNWKNKNEYFIDLKADDPLKNNANYFESLLSILSNSVEYIEGDRFLRNEKVENLNSAKLESESYKTWLYQLYMNPVGHRKYNEIVDFIKKSPLVKDIDVLKSFNPSFSTDSTGYLELMLSNDGDRLPISSFGTSIQQMIYIITRMVESKAKIILIEELELSLSPENQRKLFKMLRTLIDENLISQVFFTTHSRYFSFRNDFSIYEINFSNSHGKSTITKKDHVSQSFFNIRTND